MVFLTGLRKIVKLNERASSKIKWQRHVHSCRLRIVTSSCELTHDAGIRVSFSLTHRHAPLSLYYFFLSLWPHPLSHFLRRFYFCSAFRLILLFRFLRFHLVDVHAVPLFSRIFFAQMRAKPARGCGNSSRFTRRAARIITNPQPLLMRFTFLRRLRCGITLQHEDAFDGDRTTPKNCC